QPEHDPAQRSGLDDSADSPHCRKCIAMRIWPPEPNNADPNPTPQDDGSEQPKTLRDKIVAALKQVYDPEIPVNVYDLGLIYKIVSDAQTGKVEVEMPLTTPNCPEAEAIP